MLIAAFRWPTWAVGVLTFEVITAGFAAAVFDNSADPRVAVIDERLLDFYPPPIMVYLVILASIRVQAKARRAKEQERLRRVARVLELKEARVVERRQTLEDVAEAAIELGQQIARASAGALRLAGLQRGELRLLAHRGISPRTGVRIRTLPLTALIPSMEAARIGQPQEISDVQKAGREWTLSRQLAQSEGLRSLLTQPLVVQDRVPGTLTLL